MLLPSLAFIGVDPTSGRKAFTYAALDAEKKLLALADGEIDDVLAFVGAYEHAWVAVNAPARPNLGVVRREEVRQTLTPLHHAGRGMDMRLAEHLLRERDISVATTPARAELCPSWMQIGFAFYRRMEASGYRPYPAADAARVWLETHPQAVFATLLGAAPLSKSTLEGRLQRQLILYEQGLGIRDAMGFFEEITRHKLMRGQLPLEQVYAAEQLDAMAAAYTAWTAARKPGQVIALGDPEEGQIVLPVKELKSKY